MRVGQWQPEAKTGTPSACTGFALTALLQEHLHVSARTRDGRVCCATRMQGMIALATCAPTELSAATARLHTRAPAPRGGKVSTVTSPLMAVQTHPASTVPVHPRRTALSTHAHAVQDGLEQTAISTRMHAQTWHHHTCVRTVRSVWMNSTHTRALASQVLSESFVWRMSTTVRPHLPRPTVSTGEYAWTALTVLHATAQTGSPARAVRLTTTSA